MIPPVKAEGQERTWFVCRSESVASMTECCVRGPCDEDSRLEEGHAMSQERAEKSPAPVKYVMGFGIYLKDSRKLLKDLI